MTRASKPLTILAISAGLGAIAYVVALFLPPVYASNFTLYFPAAPPPSILSGVRLTAEADQSSVRSLGGALSSPLVASGTQSAVGILLSRTSLESVVKDLGLATKWGLTEAKAVKKLRGAINASVDKNGFLNVEVTGESPGQCKDILAGLYQHLKNRAGELTLNVSRRNREFVEGRVKIAENKANQMQDQLTRLLAESDRGAIDKVQEALYELRKKTEEARIQEGQARATIAATETNLRQLIKESRSYPNNMLALRFVNESLETLSADLLSRRQALEETMEKFTQQSAEYKGALRSVKTLDRFAQKVLDVQESALDRGVSPQLATAKTELRVLAQRVRDYSKLIGTYERELAKSAGQTAQLERAKKEFEAQMTGLATLRNELEMAKIAEARDPSRFEMVDAPEADLEPVGPRKLLIAGTIFLLALMIQAWPWMTARFKEPEV